MKSSIKNIVCLAVTCLAIAIHAHAFPTSKYATSSVLGTGKWVKIAVPTSGVYEITAEELAEMGFSNIDRVQIYGCGGLPINEKLDGTAIDDLQPIATYRTGDKLCFYGNGTIAMTLSQPKTDNPYYTRKFNAYSTLGYYFLTEVDAPRRIVVNSGAAQEGANRMNSSLDYFYHEQEISSVSFSGKQLLGEDITLGSVDIPYTLTNLSEKSVVVNCTGVANMSGAVGYLNNFLVSDLGTIEVPYTNNSKKIFQPASDYILYNIVSPLARVTNDNISDHGVMRINITTDGTVKTGKVDYFTITYKHFNKIHEDGHGQMRMGFAQPTLADCILMPDAPESMVVWNIDNPAAPMLFPTQAYDDGDEQGLEFSPGIEQRSTQFVAFDPEQELLKISSFEPVENQNIHGMATPDMIIVTNKAFIDQARRVARLHIEHDGMDVLVVDQEQVYNEFSSGTPDAMAIRLMCKMFYDRGPAKLKHLLLFGQGSFDNRGIVSVKPDRVITYESDNSNDEDNTFVTDDFFGFLDDQSGSNLASDMLRLGVGRFTSASVAEAESDVDKLYEYVLSPDYGSWRNTTMVSGEAGDSDLHIFQAEGTADNISNPNRSNTQMNVEKVYIDMFPRAVNETALEESRRTSVEAHRHMSDIFNRGTYFATYIGHAGATTFTKSSLWNVNHVNSTPYPHWPIMTTACCDVARFDDTSRGIAEHMFHKREGGAIALLTASRQVYAESNDELNNAFVSALFSYNETGKMPTLGQVFMQSKQSFGTQSNWNKLKFHLFGDPAMKINYPKPLFNITKINGQQARLSAINVRPMTNLEVEAEVLNSDGELDETFTGDAYLSLYDVSRLFKTVTMRQNGVTTTRNIYYPRELLGEVKGRVENGVFHGSIIIPRYIKAYNEYIRVSVYAHKDGTEEMVNGLFDQLRVNAYAENEATIHDDTAPVIEDMFLNDKATFDEGVMMASNSTLYITANDDYAFNTQATSVGNSMMLQLDGGQLAYYLVKSYATVSDEGRHLDIAFPLSGITNGEHTLTFTVYDVAGNSASRTINFVVGKEHALSVKATEKASVDVATFELRNSSLNTTPTVTMKVTDATGNLVWSTVTDTFPCTWNLTNNQGQRVPAGLYKYYGTYVAGDQYGGTDIDNLIVIDPLPEQ